MDRKLTLIALALAAALVLFVAWRFATLPAEWLVPPDRRAGLVAERLPLVEEVSRDRSRSDAADTTPMQARTLDGWLASHAIALEARCVDVEGRPIAGAQVVASQAGFESKGVTGADGRARIERNVAWIDWGLSLEAFLRGRPRRSLWLFDDGRLQVRVVARRGGHAAAEVWPHVILGETVQAGDLVLLPAGTVGGRVVDATGVPVAGAAVRMTEARPERVRRPDDPPSFTARRDLHATDDDGRFVIEDVPAGTIAVQAIDTQGRKGERRDVALRAGETAEVEIVLAPEPERTAIAGRVLAESGEPVARAVVKVAVQAAADAAEPRNPRIPRHATDERGTFRIELWGEPRVAVEAWDPEGVHGCGKIDDVAPGTNDLVLRLDAGRSIGLDVVRADAEPIEAFHASVYLSDEHEGDFFGFDLPPLWSDQPKGTLFASLAFERKRSLAPARIPIPRGPFVVRVASRGLRVEVLEPLDPAHAPAILRVELAALPVLRGRVTRDGAPVARAKVTSCVLLQDGRIGMRDGFPTRFEEPFRDVRTDRDGRFTLVFEAGSEVFLRAEASGSAPAEIGPLALPGDGSEFEIALGRGGDLEGEVVVDTGRDPAGIVVGISRCDGFARTQRTDRDGRFRFEYLTPGEWLLHEHFDEVQANFHGSTPETFAPEDTPPPNAHVLEGRTTFARLDLREPARLVLEGRALIDGAPLEGWTAVLVSDARSPRTFYRGRAEAKVGPDGRFELVVREPGRHRLTLADVVGWRPRRSIEDVVTIDGARTAWSCDLVTGTLAGVVARDAKRLHHLARSSQGALVRTRILPDANERFRLEGVLAGPGTIVVEPPRSTDVDAAGWPGVRTVDVPPGGVVEITLP